MQAHVQQLETALKAAAQKIHELASGEAQAQAKIAADAKAAADAIQLKRDIAVSDEEIAREKVVRDQKSCHRESQFGGGDESLPSPRSWRRLERRKHS